MRKADSTNQPTTNQYVPWALFAITCFLLIYSWGSSPSASDAPHIKNGISFVSSKSTLDGITGTVTFSQEKKGDPVSISIKLSGVPEGLHGFHIHEFGDVSTCTAAGAHFNPHAKAHGAPTDNNRHVGDLGNVKADADGNVDVEFKDTVISLSGINSIIGRAVVLHEKPDDLGKGGHDDSSTTGHAGARLACGTIAVGK